MIPLPRWMRDAFKNSVCPYCEAPCERRGVFGIGVREQQRKKKGLIFTFFFEYRCHECEKESIFPGFDTSFDSFIGDCIDISEMPFDESEKKVKQKPPEGMTDGEVADGKKMLNDCETFIEFLDRMGITEQYNLPEEEDENNQ